MGRHFLGMSNNEMDEFCEMYSEINLPFWMQTRPETINDDNMSKLKRLDYIEFLLVLNMAMKNLEKEF